MKKHPIISFFAGLIICGLIIGLVYLLALLMTFDLAGGETLQQVENQDLALLILTLVLAILVFLTARHYWKKGKKFAAYGISVLPAACLLVIAIYYVNSLNVHAEFNKTVWEQSEWKPFKMSATLVKDKKLIGLTRDQVKQMLGQSSQQYGDKSSERTSMVYPVQNSWTLTIYFQNDRVVDTQLRLPFLGV